MADVVEQAAVLGGNGSCGPWDLVDFDGYVKFRKGSLHWHRSVEELLVELGESGVIFFKEGGKESSKRLGCDEDVFF
jgi:hypothetical protein